MITVDQYHYIRMANKNYGKSIREIVRETGHARNTVRKALRGEEPGYHLSSPRRRPVIVISNFMISSVLFVVIKKNHRPHGKTRKQARMSPSMTFKHVELPFWIHQKFP